MCKTAVSPQDRLMGKETASGVADATKLPPSRMQSQKLSVPE